MFLCLNCQINFNFVSLNFFRFFLEFDSVLTIFKEVLAIRNATRAISKLLVLGNVESKAYNSMDQ